MTGFRSPHNTSGSAPDREPAWSPSGARITFVRFPHVCVVRSDGGHRREVHLGNDPNHFWESPSWQPLR